MSDLPTDARPLLRELADLPEDDWPVVLEFVRQLKQRSGAQAARIQAEISTLPNPELLALTEQRMATASAERLSLLLDRQQRGSLASAEREELGALLHIYQDGLLRQAYAWREAVQRGLRSPLAG